MQVSIPFQSAWKVIFLEMNRGNDDSSQWLTIPILQELFHELSRRFVKNISHHLILLQKGEGLVIAITSFKLPMVVVSDVMSAFYR